jgi:tetratricopeptide (TPR) repeat protein
LDASKGNNPTVQNPFSSSDPKKLVARAKVAKESGDLRQASVLYQKAIKVLGENHNQLWNVAVNNLGNLIHNSGQTAEAQKFYRLAAENGFELGMVNLAFSYESQRKNFAAMEWYQKAASLGNAKAKKKYEQLRLEEQRNQAHQKKNAEQSGTKSYTSKSSTENRKTPPHMRLIKTPRDAELNARDWMIYLGFDDARATAVGADNGIDVTSSRAIGQVKMQGVKSSINNIKNLHSTSISLSKRALFFSLSGYTQPGIDFANSVQIALFEFDYQGTISPVNLSARRLLNS